MTFDEMPVGHNRQHCACGNCEWCWEMLVRSVYEAPLDRELQSAESTEKIRTNGAQGSFYCQHCASGGGTTVETGLPLMSARDF